MSLFSFNFAAMDLEKLFSKLGITALNAMQEEAYDTIAHTGKDVVLLSSTGSGKTLAYLLPLVELLDAADPSVQALVITPGRELALQSSKVMDTMSTGLRSMACYGGRATMDEHRVIRQKLPQVIFGTPGRLNDHLDKSNISADHIRFLVIDEFDKCLEMGFHDEMSRLLAKLPGLQRRFLLSATDAEQIPHFVQLTKAVRLDFLVPEEQVSERVTLYEVHSESKDKLEALDCLLRQLGGGQSIVFLNYRDSVDRVDDFLRHRGYATSAFHGGMEQKAREDALYKFSNGSANVFVSTDLASRGLDIPDIQHIIHYHLPQGEDGYVHRVGRTARWDKTGKSYFLLGPEETMPEFVEGEVVNYPLSKDEMPVPVPPMSTLYIGKGKKDKISKGDIVGFLCKKAEIGSGDIGRIDVNDRYTYVAVSRAKVRQVLRLVQGEKIKGVRTVIEPVK